MAAATSICFLSTGSPTGLKFTVDHGGHRCLFDFGLEHAPGRAPFSMGLRPRPGRELEDLVAVGAAPALAGVYAGGGWDRRTAVFISHLHLDHTSLVGYLHPEVPLFYPAAMEPLRAAAAGSGYLGWRSPAGTPVADRETVSWGPIAVTAVAVDHDLPGATGYLVETPDLRLAYTGDHRWHGYHPEVTAAFAEAARGVDVLVQEAVSAGYEPDPGALDEPAVAVAVERVLRSRLAAGPVVVNLYPMNRERVAALGTAAEAAGRRLVLEPQAAAIAGWPHVLDPAALRAEPGRFVAQLSFEALPSLIDLPRGGLYIHSDGTPLGPFDPAFGVLEAWTRALGLELVRIASSGHSRPEDVARMVRTVAPGLVVPVHSRAPEAVAVEGVRRLLPQPGRVYLTAELLQL